MSSEQPDTPLVPVDVAPAAVMVPRALMYALVAIAAVSLLASGMLWQKLSNIQEQLARQSQEAGTTAVEARLANPVPAEE